MTSETIQACARAAQLLLDVRRKKCEPIPAGWFTAAQFAQQQECSAEFTRKALKHLVSEGLVEVQEWAQLDSLNRISYTRIYKINDNSTNTTAIEERQRKPQRSRPGRRDGKGPGDDLR